MSDTLYPYYERELTFIRQFAQDFARLYPATASRLLLEPNRCTDPHVERMIEAFALLTGRIQHRIDDDFPELTTALLGVLYPHYLAPIPSMAIVQFELDAERARSPDGFAIARHSRMSTRPVGDLPCRYRTGYPVRLWPVRISDAKLIRPPFPRGLSPPRGTVAALGIQLESEGTPKFADLALDRLRLHLKGECETVALLYDLLFNHALGVVLRDPAGTANRAPVSLRPSEALAQVGFESEDGLLPYPPQSFVGYRLLSEFFAFPNKFHFVDLCGLGHACRAGYQKQLEVIVFLDRTWPKLEQDVTAETFRLGCTPVINLFEQTAEPIPLTGARYEYRVVPDVAYPDGMEVYSVDRVTSVDPITNETTEYLPFYSLRHGSSIKGTRDFWYAARRPSTRPNDRGTEVYLSLVNLDFDPSRPSDPTLVVRTTCTNRELPRVLQQTGERLIFDLEAAAPLSRIRCIQSPSLPLQPPVRRGSYWRLISHLCLNHLSLADSTEGRESLQEILRLYDVSDLGGDSQRATVARHLIDGITSVSSRRVTGRLSGAGLVSFCRGMEITIEFDEQKYVGTGVLLFASVLERFLALYTTINSFSQLIAKTTQGEGPLKIWPPRAGDHTLI
jgi:type VI secretion system protein ImpG